MLIAKVPKNHIGIGSLINGQPFINKNLIQGKVIYQLPFGDFFQTEKNWIEKTKFNFN